MQGTLCCYCQLRPSYVWSPSSSARCLCKEKWWILMNHRATQAISCSRWGMRWWWGCKPCSQRTCENLMLQIYTSGGRGGTWVSTPTSKSEQVWLVLCRKWQPSSRRRTTAHLQDVNYQRKKKKRNTADLLYVWIKTKCEKKHILNHTMYSNKYIEGQLWPTVSWKFSVQTVTYRLYIEGMNNVKLLCSTATNTYGIIAQTGHAIFVII